MRKYTEEEQALIDGVEFGIDYGLELDPEDVAEYHRLTGSSCNILKEAAGIKTEGKIIVKEEQRCGFGYKPCTEEVDFSILVPEIHIKGKGKNMNTGLFDKKGTPIKIGDRTRLVLEDGEVREFDVCFKTVSRTVKCHPDFIDKYRKVAITGVVFCWNGYDLFPCVDKNGVFDTAKMEVIENSTDGKTPRMSDKQEAIMNFAVAVLAEVAECAKQEDSPLYDGDKEVDCFVKLSDVEKSINKYLNEQALKQMGECKGGKNI